MKRMGWMAAMGLGLWAVSNLAQAHVDLSVGIGVPGVPVYAAPAYAPVYAPAPVVAYPAYGGYYGRGDEDEDRYWRHERYEHWREHEYEHWHEHRWHDDD